MEQKLINELKAHNFPTTEITCETLFHEFQWGYSLTYEDGQFILSDFKDRIVSQEPTIFDCLAKAWLKTNIRK